MENQHNRQILEDYDFLVNNIELENYIEADNLLKSKAHRQELRKNKTKEKQKILGIILLIASILSLVISLKTAQDSFGNMFVAIMWAVVVICACYLFSKKGWLVCILIIIVGIGGIWESFSSNGLLSAVTFLLFIGLLIGGMGTLLSSPNDDEITIEDDTLAKLCDLLPKYDLIPYEDEYLNSNSLENQEIIFSNCETKVSPSNAGYYLYQCCYVSSEDVGKLWLNSMLLKVASSIDDRLDYPQSAVSFSAFNKEEFISKNTIIKEKINDQYPLISDYLHDSYSDTLSVSNDIREKYIDAIADILSSLPALPNVFEDYFSEKGRGYHKDTISSEYPLSYNVNRNNEGARGIKEKTAVITYIFREEIPNYRTFFSQPIFDELSSLYMTYKKNLDEYIGDSKRTHIGAEGEQEVVRELKFFSNQLMLLENIRLEVNGQSIESDLIIVCKQGIFIVEVKNLGVSGKYGIAIEKDGRWKKVYRDGTSENMASVSKQNVRHLHGVETIVNEALGGNNDISAHSIIVLANDTIDIQNESNAVVVRKTEIVNEIRKHDKVLSDEQIEHICRILTERNLPPLPYDMENWFKKVVLLHAELLQKYDEILPYIPYITMYDTYITALNKRIRVENPPAPTDKAVDSGGTDSTDNTNDSSHPDVPDAQETDEDTALDDTDSDEQDFDDSGYSEEDEMESAVGNCEFGNSYSYSWYDEDYNKPTWER